MSKKTKDIPAEVKADEVAKKQLEETERLIERAKKIDPLSDDYVILQERIGDSNESAKDIAELKGKRLTKLEVAEKVIGLGVGISGIALTAKELSGGMIRNETSKVLLRNVISGVTKKIKF